MLDSAAAFWLYSVVMNKNAFIAEVTKIVGKAPAKINSNNAWGFGGAIGVRWYIGDISNPEVTVTVATAYYRHLKPTDFVRVVCRARRIDADLEQSPKAFANALRALKDATSPRA